MFYPYSSRHKDNMEAYHAVRRVTAADVGQAHDLETISYPEVSSPSPNIFACRLRTQYRHFFGP